LLAVSWQAAHDNQAFTSVRVYCLHAGVAVGPNLMQWVQGLQHLASQQEEARAAKSKQKAERKKDKVRHRQRLLLISDVC
jgi:hypothetical protein